MASVPAQQGHDAPFQISEANATPLGVRRTERVRRQSAESLSHEHQEHQSVSHDEATDVTSPTPAVNGNPIPSNDAVDTTPTSGSNVVQGAPAMLTQSVQPSSQVTPMASSRVAAAPPADVNEIPETVLGKRRQSDASVSVTPNKRTKTDDPDTVPGANNNEIIGSTTEPQPNLDESTHSDNIRPAPVSKDGTPRQTPEREQTASNVENATLDPQRQEVDNARNSANVPHTSPERELHRPRGDTGGWSSDVLDALIYMEDPERQESLARDHKGRTMQLGKGLLQEVFDQASTRIFDDADGWIRSAAHSRAQGSHEIGLIAEYPVPVLRGDPRPPSPRSLFWVPGPDGLVIMCKICIGLIVMNDHNVKLMKNFTTKSGTDVENLRRSDDLEYYYQVKRSPQEDHVPTEKGVIDVFKFETFNDRGINWEIDGPRLMESMATYEHPPSMPYRIVGQLQNFGYDEDLLAKMWRDNARIGQLATRRAFKARREDPNYVRSYRTAPQSYIGDDTVVAEVSLLSVPVLAPDPVLTCFSRVRCRLQILRRPLLVQGLRWVWSPPSRITIETMVRALRTHREIRQWVPATTKLSRVAMAQLRPDGVDLIALKLL